MNRKAAGSRVNENVAVVESDRSLRGQGLLSRVSVGFALVFLVGVPLSAILAVLAIAFAWSWNTTGAAIMLMLALGYLWFSVIGPANTGKPVPVTRYGWFLVQLGIGVLLVAEKRLGLVAVAMFAAVEGLAALNWDTRPAITKGGVTRESFSAVYAALIAVKYSLTVFVVVGVLDLVLAGAAELPIAAACVSVLAILFDVSGLATRTKSGGKSNPLVWCTLVCAAVICAVLLITVPPVGVVVFIWYAVARGLFVAFNSNTVSNR